MSQTEETDIEASQYISQEDGVTKIEEDGYITRENINEMTFTFEAGKEITESVADKAQKNKKPVTYTKRGRSAYTPVTVNYPDKTTSSKMMLTRCIIQHTEALNAPNHKYAKDFVIIGIPEEYIDKIVSDAKSESGLKLAVKDNVQNMNGHYWMRCNLEKLQKKDTHIVLGQNPDGTIKKTELDLDTLLSGFKKSVVAFILFTMSGYMGNNNMDEELDLEDGTYNITMKPTEVFAVSDTDIQGPVLQDTNNRKNEGVSWTGHFFADGALAEFALKRLKISGK